MKQLSLTARLYLAAAILIGAALLVLRPPLASVPEPYLFVMLVVISTLSATYAYKIYLGRRDAQRHVQETSDLHLATIEALAGAIDAKDQMTQLAHPARADLRGRTGRGDRTVGAEKSRASRPRRCCTTSASSRCPSTSSRSPGR